MKNWHTGERVKVISLTNEKGCDGTVVKSGGKYVQVNTDEGDLKFEAVKHFEDVKMIESDGLFELKKLDAFELSKLIETVRFVLLCETDGDSLTIAAYTSEIKRFLNEMEKIRNSSKKELKA